VESGLKLLPCPFCGGAPVVEPEGPRYFVTFCERCDIIGPFGNGIEDAAKRWNTRAPSDAALVEALERLVVNYGEPHPLARAHLETEDLRFARAALAAAKGQQP